MQLQAACSLCDSDSSYSSDARQFRGGGTFGEHSQRLVVCRSVTLRLRLSVGHAALKTRQNVSLTRIERHVTILVGPRASGDRAAPMR